jgi:hypothetical protein
MTPQRAGYASPDAATESRAGGELGHDQTTPKPKRGGETPVSYGGDSPSRTMSPKVLFPAGNEKRDASPEKNAAVQGVGSSLMTLIEKVYNKLDPGNQGFLKDLKIDNEEELSPFERSLIDLCHNRFVYQMERGGYSQGLKKDEVIKMLCQAMEADFTADPKDGTVKMRSTDKKRQGDSAMPLETAMRSVQREARKHRNGNFGYVQEDPAALCTFKPVINKHDVSRAASDRKSPALGQLSRPMSTRDMKEYVELQECTFQPNLHKCIGGSNGAGTGCRWHWDSMETGPRYRSSRLPGRDGAPRLRKSPHWVDTLRGGWGAGKPPKHYVQPPKDVTQNPEKVIQPEMAFTLEKSRHDLNGPMQLFTAPTADAPKEAYDSRTQGERDWGKYIRLQGRGFEVGMEQGLEDDEEEAATRQFADKFLSLRQSGARTRNVFV